MSLQPETDDTQILTQLAGYRACRRCTTQPRDYLSRERAYPPIYEARTSSYEHSLDIPAWLQVHHTPRRNAPITDILRGCRFQ